MSPGKVRQSEDDPGAALVTSVRAVEPSPRRVIIGYSGGPDSTLLLALALRHFARRRVCAIHVHHGWHQDADRWAEHCRSTARALGTRCEVVRVDARPRAGEGPEAAARAARYRALGERVGPRDVLVTAHHRDDQAETLLLALLRGGGVHGWSAMPVWRVFGGGVHVRPWLGIARAHLGADLDRLGLPWLDDPANADPAFDRAWLRRDILPALAARWPAVGATLARAAVQARDAAAAVDALAARDYVHCRGAVDDTLECSSLGALEPRRQRALLRWWIARAGRPRPPAAVIDEACRQLTRSAADRSPRIAWQGGEVRAWRGLAWLLAPRRPVDPSSVHVWTDPLQPLRLPDRVLPPHVLTVANPGGERFGHIEVRYRRGGERYRPAGAARSEPLGELLRRAGVPPWERERAPLIYADGELVAVPVLDGTL